MKPIKQLPYISKQFTFRLQLQVQKLVPVGAKQYNYVFEVMDEKGTELIASLFVRKDLKYMGNKQHILTILPAGATTAYDSGPCDIIEGGEIFSLF